MGWFGLDKTRTWRKPRLNSLFEVGFCRFGFGRFPSPFFGGQNSWREKKRVRKTKI